MLAPRPAAAQTGPRVSLDTAVEIALAENPSVALARQRLALDTGILQEASGMFDPVVESDFTFSHARGELIPRGLRAEQGRRELFNQFATILQRVADDMQRNLDRTPEERASVPCTEGVFTSGTTLILTDPSTGEQIIIRCDPGEKSDESYLDEALAVFFAGEHDPEFEAEIERLRKLGIETSRTEMLRIIQSLNATAKSLREDLRKLGITPILEERTTFTVLGGLRIPLRNGWIFTPRAGIQAIENNFVGKPQDPALGGKDDPITATAALGFELFIPLGEGRGVGVADALEQAAAANVRATTEQFRRAQDTTAVRVAAAYWQLAAAEQRLAIAEENAERGATLLSFARQYRQADEIAALELTQARARARDTDRELLRARQELVSARIDLALAMGLEVESVEATPLTLDGIPLPGPEPPATVGELQEIALANRVDLLADMERIEAARILTEAARQRLEPQIDLTLSGGYSGTHASFSHSDAIDRALFGNWQGPSVSMALRWAAPLHNRGDRGRLAQAVSIQSRSELAATETRRAMSSRIVELYAAIRATAAALRELEASEYAYRDAVAGELERLRVGEGTLLDGIFLDEQLASARLAVLQARLRWALLLTDLRYETGTILSHELLDATPGPQTWSTLPTTMDR